ncbi:MAG: UTP--glucose-1-phosphate uridylyltransferase [Bdellovibrionales bacterium GWA2_49_15]|nr:MAG: UTP--glucose-1-phosphate uridylyltransferase [Bdellovibrionales bacterium GWA2_49_15]
MKIKQAVIPVAGKGTRFLPATKEIPKEMIPIIDIPMIHYIVQEAIDSGIQQIIFVNSTNKESIENYFDRNYALEKFLEMNNKHKELELIQKIGTLVDIVSVRQKEQLGLGHAILTTERIIGKDNFAVLLGDDLIRGIQPCTGQLMKISETYGDNPVIGIMDVPKAEVSKYGIIDGTFVNGEKQTVIMKEMVEKPSPENTPTTWATPGRYILSGDIFEYLKKIKRGAGGEYQLTDAINMMCKSRSVYAHFFTGRRYDTGNIFGYFEATLNFALSDPRLKTYATELIKKLAKDLSSGKDHEV